MKDHILTCYFLGAVAGGLLGSLFSEQIGVICTIPGALLGGVWGWRSGRTR